MKLGILDALRLTVQTGQPPARQPEPEGTGPLLDIHQQLLDSLEERSSPSTSTYSPRPSRHEGQAPSIGTRARWGRTAPQKGTIEEALGEERPLGSPDLAPLLQAKVDLRASDGESAVHHTPKAVPEGVLAVPCGHCHATGFAEVLRGRFAWCGWCKGEGYVGVDGLALVQPQPDVNPVELALSREREGEQVLPLEDDLSGPAEMQVISETLGPEIVEEFFAAVSDPLTGMEEPPAPAALLTYDLPTTVDDLPLFCYVRGPAGCGKTFWAKALAASDPEGVILAATTGIAAVNLGEGTTINSLLKYYDTNSLAEAFTGGWLESQLVRLRRAGLRRIVLDEISMLDGDQLTILSRALDNVNASRGAGDVDLGLILVGDFAQLPPVGALDVRPKPGRTKAIFAFESPEWDRYAQHTFALTTIRRQADQDFIQALQAVRCGDVAQALDFFGPRLEALTLPAFEGTTLLAKNDAVEKYNQLRLDKVSGKPISFTSERWGKLRSEWGGPPKPPAEWGIPEILKLKEGALVMILANRNVAEKGSAMPEYLYVNGDLGTMVSAEHGAAIVQLQRTGEEVEVIPILRENLIPLEVGRRKALREAGHSERVSASGKHEVIGAVSYVPLRLAYASTVHKSQGLSLDAVQVNIRDHFFSSSGMAYVAFSRARTAEGLRIVGTPEGLRARVGVHPKIQEWL